eukprot:gene31007-53239_t
MVFRTFDNLSYALVLQITDGVKALALERAELKAWLRLTLSPGVGNNTARKLLAAFGSAEAVFGQSTAALRQLGSDKLVSAITTEPAKLADLLQATVDWLA